jgi:hypothetical protein
MMKAPDKISIPLNVICFLGTGLISLLLGFGMVLWWLFIVVAAWPIVYGKSRRNKAAAWSSLACIACFLLAFLLWPVFRIISPKYFDENYDPKTGKVIDPWQQPLPKHGESIPVE